MNFSNSKIFQQNNRHQKNRIVNNNCFRVVTNSLPKKQKIDDISSRNVHNLCRVCQCPPVDGDVFLCCTNCNAKAHSSCLRFSPELSEIFKDDPWKCSKCEAEFNFDDLRCKEDMYVCDICGKHDHSMFRSPECEKLKCPESYRLCSHCFIEYIQSQLEELVKQKELLGENKENEELKEKSEVGVKGERFLSLENEDYKIDENIRNNREEQEDIGGIQHSMSRKFEFQSSNV